MKLLGYRTGVSKKSGKPYGAIFCVGVFNDVERQSGAVGSPVKEIGIFGSAAESIIPRLTPDVVGKEIKPIYDCRFDGTAEFVGFEVFEPKAVTK